MNIINDKTFENEIQKFNGTALLDFYAPWCGPCRVYGPTFEKVSESYPQVKFAKVNIDDSQEIAVRYKVDAIPMTIMFRNGNVVEKWTGVVKEGTLRKAIDDEIKETAAKV